MVHLATLEDELTDGTLIYVVDEAMLSDVKISSNLTVLVPEGTTPPSTFNLITVKDPAFIFWSLYEFVERSKTFSEPTFINKGAKIGENVTIADHGVTIEKNVIIDAHVVIEPGVTIKQGVHIGAGCVIGSSGLEVKNTIYGSIIVSHKGGVEIDEDVKIGALCTINQGLGQKPTFISSGTKIDCGVHIAHSCFIGARNTIAAQATFGGSVKTGDNVFVGLNATIKNGITISDNSFVGASTFVAESYSRPVKVIPASQNLCLYECFLFNSDFIISI